MSASPTQSFVATFTVFRDIALLRRGPQDLPVSARLLLGTIIAQVVLGLVIGSMVPQLPAEGAQDHSLALLLIDLGVTLLWGWTILRAVGRPERFLQTMTAIFGCQLVLQPLMAPAAWAVASLGKESSWALPAALVVYGLSVWAMIALARIVRAATDWSMFACIAVVLAQSGLTWLVVFAVFPDMAELLKQAQ